MSQFRKPIVRAVIPPVEEAKPMSQEYHNSEVTRLLYNKLAEYVFPRGISREDYPLVTLVYDDGLAIDLSRVKDLMQARREKNQNHRATPGMTDKRLKELVIEEEMGQRAINQAAYDRGRIMSELASLLPREGVVYVDATFRLTCQTQSLTEYVRMLIDFPDSSGVGLHPMYAFVAWVPELAYLTDKTIENELRVRQEIVDQFKRCSSVVYMDTLRPIDSLLIAAVYRPPPRPGVGSLNRMLDIYVNRAKDAIDYAVVSADPFSPSTFAPLCREFVEAHQKHHDLLAENALGALMALGINERDSAATSGSKDKRSVFSGWMSVSDQFESAASASGSNPNPHSAVIDKRYLRDVSQWFSPPNRARLPLKYQPLEYRAEAARPKYPVSKKDARALEQEEADRKARRTNSKK